MPLEYAKPTLTGGVRSARMSGHSVRMPDPLEGLGKSISNFGNTLLGVGEMGVKHALKAADEKANNEYASAMLDFERERDARVQEIMQNGGTDMTSQIDAAYKDLISKYSPKVKGAYAEKFNRSARADWNANLRGARDKQYQNGIKLRTEALENDIKSKAEIYASTFDTGVIDGVQQSYDDYYRSIGKYGLTPTESLSEFDSNIKDGYLDVPERTLPDGTLVPEKHIKISDGGEEGTISNARLNQIRTDLEYKSKQYERGKQNVIDTFHAKAIDALLNEDRVDEAMDYFYSQQAGDRPIGATAAQAIEKTLNARFAAKEKETMAQITVDSTLFEMAQDDYISTLTGGGKYLDSETEARLDGLLVEARKTGGDADELNLLKKEIERVKTIRREQLKIDTAIVIGQLHKEGKLSAGNIDKTCMSLMAKASSNTANMCEQNVLASALKIRKNYESQERIRRGLSTESDRALLDDIGKTKMVLSYMRAKGAMVNYKGVNYDISTEAGFNNFASQSGFTEEQLKAIKSKWADTEESIVECTDTAVEILNSLNDFDPKKGEGFRSDSVLALAPEFVNYLVQNYKDLGNLTGGQKKTAIKDLALKFLKDTYTTEEKSFWFDKKHYLHEFLARGIDDEGDIIEDNGTPVYNFNRWLEFGLSPETQRIIAETNTVVTNAAKGKYEDVSEKLLTEQEAKTSEYLNTKTNDKGELVGKEESEYTKQKKAEEEADHQKWLKMGEVVNEQYKSANPSKGRLF